MELICPCKDIAWSSDLFPQKLHITWKLDYLSKVLLVFRFKYQFIWRKFSLRTFFFNIIDFKSFPHEVFWRCSPLKTILLFYVFFMNVSCHYLERSFPSSFLIYQLIMSGTTKHLITIIPLHPCYSNESCFVPMILKLVLHQKESKRIHFMQF